MEKSVDIFILISAYFMINSKFTFKKLLTLCGEVWFYSIGILLLFLTILEPTNPINAHFLIQSVFPITQSHYWFITDYILLMLFSPFLNKLIKNLSKESHLKLILMMTAILCIFPMVTGFSTTYNAIILFVLLYFIGSFIHLHVSLRQLNGKKLALSFIGSLIISMVLYCGISHVHLITDSDIIFNLSTYFWSANSIFIVISSLSLFLIFLKRREFSNSYINLVAASSLGVYLIHENIFFRTYLWKSILNMPNHYSSPDLILYAIMSVIVIYIVCTGIDILRRLTVEKIWIHIIDRKLNAIPKWLNIKFKSLAEKL